MEQNRFWERRAVRGLALTLDEQRGALVLRIDASRLPCEFWIKQPQASLGFHAMAARHVIHGQPAYAVVFTSLPSGLYVLHRPVWAAGARFVVAVGRVTYAEAVAAHTPA